jgi:hypothetical protein
MEVLLKSSGNTVVEAVAVCYDRVIGFSTEILNDE